MQKRGASKNNAARLKGREREMMNDVRANAMNAMKAKGEHDEGDNYQSLVLRCSSFMTRPARPHASTTCSRRLVAS
jgi:hypothetical protein